MTNPDEEDNFLGLPLSAAMAWKAESRLRGLIDEGLVILY
jgi:hypothetical protein